MKYQIIEQTYRNEYGEEKRKVYTIRRRKRFLGISYWSNVTHKECGMSDIYNTVTEFESHSQAHEFILNVLCENRNRDGWSYKVVSEFDCRLSKDETDE